MLPWISVIENLTLGLSRTDAKIAALAMLEAVGLGDKAESGYTLPRGQKQGAALARSLLRRPELLLADEPFGALYALIRIRMHGLLFQLIEHNKPTVVLVTHDVDEALLLSDRILVLKDGRIVEDHRVDLPRLHQLRRRLLASFGVRQNLI
ncbi:ATP-binding cassette domain-containing protein [Phyllobacterium ifriqiyense]|uniref:ATP-binding cassette domain-containing protein n=1 Tax=Phyllobacterium ifriqiyense TaxID=314238 RepID=UPI00339641D1